MGGPRPSSLMVDVPKMVWEIEQEFGVYVQVLDHPLRGLKNFRAPPPSSVESFGEHDHARAALSRNSYDADGQGYFFCHTFEDGQPMKEGLIRSVIAAKVHQSIMLANMADQKPANLLRGGTQRPQSDTDRAADIANMVRYGIMPAWYNARSSTIGAVTPSEEVVQHQKAMTPKSFIRHAPFFPSTTHSLDGTSTDEVDVNTSMHRQDSMDLKSCSIPTTPPRTFLGAVIGANPSPPISQTAGPTEDWRAPTLDFKAKHAKRIAISQRWWMGKDKTSINVYHDFVRANIERVERGEVEMWDMGFMQALEEAEAFWKAGLVTSETDVLLWGLRKERERDEVNCRRAHHGLHRFPTIDHFVLASASSTANHQQAEVKGVRRERRACFQCFSAKHESEANMIGEYESLAAVNNEFGFANGTRCCTRARAYARADVRTRC